MAIDIYQEVPDSGEPVILRPSYNNVCFPEVVDNSMRSSLVACPMKFFNNYCLRAQTDRPSVHLQAGKAFAHGLEHMRRAYYEDSKDAEEALEIGINELVKSYADASQFANEAKSLERMIGALVYYAQMYPMATDKIQPVVHNTRLGVEFNFAIPLPECINPDTGQPLIYAGRFDMLGKMGNRYGLEDDKTTSSLGAQWANQWALDSQATGYMWACREHGIDVRFAVFRGISILKTKYDTMESIQYRSEWEIQRWYHQLVRDMNRAIAQYVDYQSQAIPFDQALDKGICGMYGGCSYKPLCDTKKPENFLSTQYVLSTWSPLGSGE